MLDDKELENFQEIKAKQLNMVIDVNKKIKIYNKIGSDAEVLYLSTLDDKPIGIMIYNHNIMQSRGLSVHSSQRRKGYGTFMYKYFESKHNIKIKPYMLDGEAVLSKDGEKFYINYKKAA